MGAREDDLSNQYEILQDIVNQSSIHTDRQLKTINANSYIGGFILLTLALAISYFLNIFEYWIPAGFLLFYFLSFTAFRSIRKPFVHKDIKDILNHYKEKHKAVNHRIESSLYKNIATITQSLTIIYIISFFILLSIRYNWIAIENTIDTTIPLITCLLFLPVPFFIKEFYQLIKPSELKIYLKKNLEKNVDTPWKSVFTWDFLNPFFFAIYLTILIVLPIYSIYLIRSIIAQWPYFLLIFILQSLMIILFTNSFSANSIKKEFTSTITIYADIDYLLNIAKLQKHYSTSEYEHLQTVFKAAKPYDFKILDSFRFINYYMLIPNRFYLKEMMRKEKQNPIETNIHSIQNQEIKPKRTPTVNKLPTPSPFKAGPLITKPKPNMASAEPTKEPESENGLDNLYLQMSKNIDDIKLGNIGIILYGPMIDNISSELKSVTKKHLKNIRTPFKVELARKNNKLGGAPEIVPVNKGGARINADLLILIDKVTEKQALDMLYRMQNDLEGTNRIYKKPENLSPNSFVIKSIDDYYGINKVLYPSIGRNINQVTPKKLAKLTMDSVLNTEEKEPDGFSYLMDLRKFGIVTPMIKACEEEILHQTYSSNLMESRKKLESVKSIKSSIE